MIVAAAAATNAVLKPKLLLQMPLWLRLLQTDDFVPFIVSGCHSSCCAMMDTCDFMITATLLTEVLTTCSTAALAICITCLFSTCK
jgi:hypothetical protein